jgi:hypothetical protein
MELVILFAIVALLLLGPRRGGGMPTRAAIIAGIAFLVWMAFAFGLTSLWRVIVGDVQQP